MDPKQRSDYESLIHLGWYVVVCPLFWTIMPSLIHYQGYQTNICRSLSNMNLDLNDNSGGLMDVDSPK